MCSEAVSEYYRVINKINEYILYNNFMKMKF